MDLKYMKQLRWGLNTVGCWPRRAVGERASKYWILYSVFLFIMSLFLLITGFLYLERNFKDMHIFELGHTYITVLMTSTSVCRVVLPFHKKYIIMTEAFVKEFHLLHFKDTFHSSKKVYRKMDKLSRYVTIYYMFLPFFALLCFHLQPMYSNYVNGLYSSDRPENATFKHTAYYVLPFDYETNFRNYLGLYFFNWYASYVCAACFSFIDLYMILIVIHIFGHLNILLDDMNEFPKPKTSDSSMDTLMFSDDELVDVFRRLRGFVEHHKFIMKFVSITMQALSTLLCVYFAFYQIVLFMVLLMFSQLDIDAIIAYGNIALFFFIELVLISVVFELLGTMSDKVRVAVYGLPWECMDTKNRKIVLFFLHTVQEPIGLKALGILPVGVNTMAAIIKNTISYFLMLRATV